MNKIIKTSTSFPFYHQSFFYFLMVLFSLAGLYLVKSYISTIIMAVIFSLFLRPVYLWLLTKFKGASTWAVSVTVASMCLLVVVPLALFLLYLTNEVVKVTQSVELIQVMNDSNQTVVFRIGEQQIDITERLSNVDQWVKQVTWGQYSVTLEQLQQALQSSLGPLRQWAVKTLVTVGSGSVNFLVKLVMFIILLVSIIPNQEMLVKYLKRLSPLDDTIDDVYLLKIKSMAMSMVKGTLFIAAIQSLLSAIMLWIVGVPYVMTFFILMLIVSLIPMLGAPLVTVPIGVIYILGGNVTQGTLIILVQLLGISSVDNILRPKMVPKSAMLHPALVLLGVFGGLEIFGFLGVIYGPVLMILLITTLEVYLQYYAVDQSGVGTVESQNKQRVNSK